MALNAKWAWVADTQGFALLLLLCQRAADGRRAESSFGKAELFWSSCDGLSCSGLCWAGAGPRTPSLMGTHGLGLRWDGCPFDLLLAGGAQHQLLCWQTGSCSWLPKLSWSWEEALSSLGLTGTEGCSAAKHNVQWKRSSGPPQDSRYIKALPTAPSDGDLHWNTYKEGQKWRSEYHHCLDT